MLNFLTGISAVPNEILSHVGRGSSVYVKIFVRINAVRRKPAWASRYLAFESRLDPSHQSPKGQSIAWHH